MPSQIGQDLGVDPPAVGATGPGYATTMNAAVQACIDAIEAGATTSTGLTVDSAVEFNGYNLTEAGAVHFESKSGAYTTATGCYFRSGDFYVNDSSGNQIRITASGALNSAAVGGIGGDYGGSNPASVTFNEASSKYIFLESASVKAALEFGTARYVASTSGNVVSVLAPASLAASYTVTWPTAVPASNGSALVMSTAGVISTTMTPSWTSVTASGAISGATVTTAEAGIRRGEATVSLSPFDARVWDGVDDSTVSIARNGGTGTWYISLTASEYCLIPLHVTQGDRIKAVTVQVMDTNAGSGAVTAKLFKATFATAATRTQVGATQTSAADGTEQTLTISGLTESVAASVHYYIEIQAQASVVGARYFGGTCVTDKVA
jgi:hypothetical protein